MADRKFTYQEGVEIGIPVAANTTIEIGKLCWLDSSGYLTQTIASGVYFAGIANEHVVCGATAAAVSAVVIRRGWVSLVSSGLTAADLGKTVYPTNATTVSLTMAGYASVGKIVSIVSATSAIVDISGAQYGSQFDAVFVVSAALAAPSENSVIIGKFKLPFPVRIVSGWVDVGTAPGGSYVNTTTITDGTTPKTVTVTGAAVHGEDAAIATTYAANTYITISTVDDNASAATAALNARFVCQIG